MSCQVWRSSALSGAAALLLAGWISRDLDSVARAAEMLARGEAPQVRASIAAEVVELGAERFDVGGEPGDVRPGQRNKLGIGVLRQLPSLFDFDLEPREAFRRPHDRHQQRVLPAQ